jgi:hypothetical protein
LAAPLPVAAVTGAGTFRPAGALTAAEFGTGREPFPVTELAAPTDLAALSLRLPYKILSPAIVTAPMNKIRVNQTRIATNIGTIRSNCSRPKISLPSSCDTSTDDTAHQVITAFIVAPSSHAPVKYQTSFGSSFPRSGVNRRARPAKSIAQNATAKIVAQVKVAKRTSPSKLCSA